MSRRSSQPLSQIAAAGAFAVLATAAIVAQAPANPAPTQSGSLTTLSGCVGVNPNDRKSFTLADPTWDEVYVLKGLNVKDFVGKQVEITGSPSRRLRIVGGLYPTPNIAGQAGTDPVQAAQAAHTPPAANTTRPPIEFNVKSVRTVPGTCEKAGG